MNKLIHYPLIALTLSMAMLSAQSERPNIVFMFSDDHSQQAIGAYNYPLAKFNPTPNIDKLAKEGMRFDRFYVANSICAPSRATLLTGKHSHINGKIDNRGGFNHDQQQFQKILQKNGYQTAMIGKIHLNGAMQGFDYWDVLHGQGDYYQPTFKSAKGIEVVKGYVTDIVTDKAIDWLQNKRDTKKPFMLMVHHKGTHREWSPAPRHLTRFDDVEMPIPDTFFDDYATRGTAAKKQDMSIAHTMSMHDDLKVKTAEYKKQMEEKIAGKKKKNPGYLPNGEWGSYFRMTPEQRAAWDKAYEPKNQALWAAKLTGKDLYKWKYQRYVKDYLRTALSIDESMGRMLEWLKANNLDKNTIVMYSSDQGFYLGEHGWFDKRFMYEESYRTPLIVRWPNKIKAGSVNSDLCQNIDFAETFLDIAGVEAPIEMQGESFVPLLKGEKPANWRKSLYYHYYEYPAVHSVRKHEGVSTQRYKLIKFYGPDVINGTEWEFYDLITDPKEINNSIENPKHADKIAELKLELTRLKKQYKVPESKPLHKATQP